MGPLSVTRPSLPSLSDLLPLLEQIWSSRILTNGGPLLQEFEAALALHLGIPFVSPVANATLGLMVALRQLDIKGEVITTPFSFVATAHAILWAGCTPVFADIDPVTMNMDPSRIEAQITERTSAILAVHCYGQACDVEAIESIARERGLAVIYDAAHAFGVKHRGRSVLTWGDLSVLSFHATKVFNTFEGGAIASPSSNVKTAVDRLCNYGIVDEVTVDRVGLNAKMSEFNAAIGLLQLKMIDQLIDRRKEVDLRYRYLLANTPGVRCPERAEATGRNYYAFPILIEPEFGSTRDEVFAALRSRGIHARRYFHPLLSSLPMYRSLPSSSPENLPVAHSISSRILCLPMFPELAADDQIEIVSVIRDLAR